VGQYASQATLDKTFVACYDLSAFTDRFPAEVQRRLLFALLPQDLDLANAFWTLLAKRTFTLAWSGEQVTYNCGQPMGAYGSWPLCSLAHHLLVEYGAAGIKDVKSKYRLIGDDLIITDERIAQNYETNVKALGLNINFDKTVKSEANSTNSAAEIAKQLYLNGISLTPITPGLVRNLRQPLLVNQAFEELAFRLNIEASTFPPVLIDWVFPKDKLKQTVLVLLGNPLTGAMRREANIAACYWADIELEELVREYWQIRLENLSKVAEQVSAGVIAMQRPDGTYEFGADWQLDTHFPEAKAFASIEIMSQVQKAQEILMELMFDDEAFEEDYVEDSVAMLQEVEFLDDPAKPFMARKERREIQRSSTILEALQRLQ
jgi:hypothetical protein